MKEQFELIRQQIHDIRSFLGPLDLKLEGLDYQIKRSRATFELKALEFETQLALHSSQIAKHSEQIRQIQLFINMPQAMDRSSSSPPEN